MRCHNRGMPPGPLMRLYLHVCARYARLRRIRVGFSSTASKKGFQPLRTRFPVIQPTCVISAAIDAGSEEIRKHTTVTCTSVTAKVIGNSAHSRSVITKNDICLGVLSGPLMICGAVRQS